jgi:two-component system sensor histidine kinase DesK
MNSQEAGRAPLYYEMRYEVPAWSHFVWMMYLGFLFTPLLTPGHGWAWMWPTLLTIPVFVALYVSAIFKFRRSNPPGAKALPEVLIIAVMGYLLAPVNDSANTYLVYSVAIAPFAVIGFRRMALLVGVLLSLYGIELAVLGFKPLLFGITIMVGAASGASNYMMLENRRKNLALRRSAEEVQRLARVAERERIGRDLHDLLGHTLSLVAIKSELAAKLINRDRDAAAREITEVMNIARDSLRQVRTAVTGLRSAVLEGEMVSARALLETVGVKLTCQRDAMVLSAEIETSLAMIVREAVTNVQRHARAQRASIEVLALAEEKGREKGVLLLVTDDGRGGINAEGNGLAGIRERVQSLGGTLDIDSPSGDGTRVRVRVPLLASAATTPAVAMGGRPRVLHIETMTDDEIATTDVNADAPAVHT